MTNAGLVLSTDSVSPADVSATATAPAAAAIDALFERGLVPGVEAGDNMFGDG